MQPVKSGRQALAFCLPAAGVVIVQIVHEFGLEVFHGLKDFCRDARAIYAAVSLQAAQEALRQLQQNWAGYPSALRVWTDNFEQVERLFELPGEIRRMVYTTNLVEGFHSGLRKVTRGKAAFPNDDAVLKALFLRILDITKKWTVPVPNWARVLGQIDALFPDCL